MNEWKDCTISTPYAFLGNIDMVRFILSSRKCRAELSWNSELAVPLRLKHRTNWCLLVFILTVFSNDRVDFWGKVLLLLLRSAPGSNCDGGPNLTTLEFRCKRARSITVAVAAVNAKRKPFLPGYHRITIPDQIKNRFLIVSSYLHLANVVSSLI